MKRMNISLNCSGSGIWCGKMSLLTPFVRIVCISSFEFSFICHYDIIMQNCDGRAMSWQIQSEFRSAGCHRTGIPSGRKSSSSRMRSGVFTRRWKHWHPAFMSNMASDIDYMRELYNELKNYVNVLEEAKGSYQKAQQSVCDRIGGIWV